MVNSRINKNNKSGLLTTLHRDIKYTVIMAAFFLVLPLHGLSQVIFYEYGMGAGVVVPIKIPYAESSIGFGITTFEEFGLSESFSIYSGAGLYLLQVKERDEYLNEYHNWTIIDVIFDLGPKIYFSNLYTKMGFGFIWGRSFRFAFIPAIGYRYNFLDVAVNYNHSNDYSFIEFRLGFYIF